MLGHFAHWAPWSVLKGHVFPYTSMRVPSRFRLLQAAFVAIFIGIAIDRLPATLVKVCRGRWPVGQIRIVVRCVALIAVGDVFGTASSIVASKFDGPKESPVAVSQHLYVDVESANFIDQPRQNRARLACWDEWGFTAGAPLWYGDVPQARATDGHTVVEGVRRTQNSFGLDVNVGPVAGEVLLNSSWDRGWRTSHGRVFERNKQMVLELPPGRYRVRVHYWPVGLTAGLIVTALAIVGISVLAGRERLRAIFARRNRGAT